MAEPVNGVNYAVAVQTPQYKMDSLDAILRTPVTSAAGGNTQLLSNVLGSVKRDVTTTLISHYNVQPIYDVLANTDQRDLGGVSDDVQKILDETTKHLPPATTIAVPWVRWTR